jgi:hypothetical protein
LCCWGRGRFQDRKRCWTRRGLAGPKWTRQLGRSPDEGEPSCGGACHRRMGQLLAIQRVNRRLSRVGARRPPANCRCVLTGNRWTLAVHACEMEAWLSGNPVSNCCPTSTPASRRRSRGHESASSLTLHRTHVRALAGLTAARRVRGRDGPRSTSKARQCSATPAKLLLLHAAALPVRGRRARLRRATPQLHLGVLPGASDLCGNSLRSLEGLHFGLEKLN